MLVIWSETEWLRFSVVPFLGLGVSAWLYEHSSIEVAPAGHGLLGCDLLLTREWNVGLDVRLGLVRQDGGPHTTFESALRLSRLFELL